MRIWIKVYIWLTAKGGYQIHAWAVLCVDKIGNIFVAHYAEIIVCAYFFILHFQYLSNV